MSTRSNTMQHQDSEEASRDPGVTQHYTSNLEDFEGHRHHTSNVYSGRFALPANMNTKKRSSSRKHKHHHHKTSRQESVVPMEDPSTRVQFLLGEDADKDGETIVRPIFSEMETLVLVDNQYQWKETARWVKFEEDVEEGGERWSKPHVATLSLHALFELRAFLLKGCVLLDMDCQNFEQIADLAIEALVNGRHLEAEHREQLKDLIMRKHKHLYESKSKENGNNMSKLPLIRSLAEIGRNHSTAKNMMTKSNTVSNFLRSVSFLGSSAGNAETTIDINPSSTSLNRNQSGDNLNSQLNIDKANHKGNHKFMSKIPLGAEASNILVGEVPFLKRPLAVFIRLSEATFLGDLTEVPVPTRFIFIHMGPPGGLSHYHENGRAMATLFSDDVFHEVAYKAQKNEHLLAGIDEFLDAVTVLPPGEWDPAIRIEPPALIPKRKKEPKKHEEEEIDEEEEELKMRESAGLVRTGKLFGGLMNDFKRKAPWYLSDYTDGFSMQSVATFFFLYFACLTPIITFGGLLADNTGKNIAAMESLVAGLICGVAYGMFSGQPLTILGSTGPVLVFESIVYKFCTDLGWDYLEFRVWIGLWCGLILITLVAIDASYLVCYITRFTEENFATLIAFIFIFKAIEKVIHIEEDYPMDVNTVIGVANVFPCDCVPYGNVTVVTDEVNNVTEFFNATSVIKAFSNGTTFYTREECKDIFNGTMIGKGCPDYYKSDIFLFSVILFLGTFTISKILKDFRGASFFPAKVRAFVSDFAVIIAILLMVSLDMLVGIKTPKLEVPVEFKPTLDSRGWFIHPYQKNEWWTCLVAIVPALLATILIFMDQQITAVIINRKEFKLKKGGGYHLDLFVVAILIVVNSLMGLPWFVAATVLSINHVNSLKIESECAAPGEKPQFLGIQENRVTHILIFVFIGLSVLMMPILRMIPMPVLFGVFLYMGISALKGLQFFDRILIMFMPAKYQPDYAFLRQVPIKRVHMFTAIQMICLAVLWIIKSFKETSILFPVMLVVMIGIRKLLDLVFTQEELRILDDCLPNSTRKKRMHVDDNSEADDAIISAAPADGMMTIPLASGNVMKVPVAPINISEEMNASGIWQGMDHSTPGHQSNSNQQNCLECHDKERKRKSRRERKERESLKIKNSNGHVVANGHKNNNQKNTTVNFSVSADDEDVELTTMAKNRSHKKDATTAEEKRRLSIMTEEEEPDMADNFTIKVPNLPR